MDARTREMDVSANYKSLFGVSLFSGAGIGDLGFRAAGVNFLAMCEVEKDRAALAKLNFPKADHFADDIVKIADAFCKSVEAKLENAGQELFLLTCTAPCQGMSKSGQGTLLRNIREGKRPQLDPRNRLILPALEIIGRLRPHWVVFENVSEMRTTLIEDKDAILRSILEIIEEKLGSDYAGGAYNVEFADYGVPQRRQHLITVFTKHEVAKKRFADGLPLIPVPTHSETGEHGTHRWISVMEALKGFPPLDSIDKEHAVCSSIPFHHVPVLDPKKYEWIRHAPPGASAFDNQCINPECRHQRNTTHGNTRQEGINRASRNTPLYCEECGALLPRPYTVDSDGKKRIMSGYTSAYKRMNPDLPAPALTRNLSYPCSDNKVHPYQNRVLSLAEAGELQTITKYEYKWGPIQVGKKILPLAGDGLIRLVIGESVPPMFLDLLGNHIRALSVATDLPDALNRVRQPTQMTLL